MVITMPNIKVTSIDYFKQLAVATKVDYATNQASCILKPWLRVAPAMKLRLCL